MSSFKNTKEYIFATVSISKIFDFFFLYLSPESIGPSGSPVESRSGFAALVAIAAKSPSPGPSLFLPLDVFFLRHFLFISPSVPSITIAGRQICGI